MRARWVQNAPSVSPPTVAWTVVARWLPTIYFLVSTIEVRTATSDDTLSVLIRKMNPDARDTWVSQVFRCTRDGFGHSDVPLYSREYADEISARHGHAEIVEALQSGKRKGALLGYKPDEIVRLSWLRSVEWLSWPAFVSQPILPALYLFWPWYYVWAWLAVATLAWRFLRYRFVSYTLASTGCLFVRLKWPVMLIFSIYYFWHRAYVLAVLTLATPLVPMLMTILSTGMVGLVQKRLLRELLFESDLQALVEAENKAQSTGP